MRHSIMNGQHAKQLTAAADQRSSRYRSVTDQVSDVPVDRVLTDMFHVFDNHALHQSQGDTAGRVVLAIDGAKIFQGFLRKPSVRHELENLQVWIVYLYLAEICGV